MEKTTILEAKNVTKTYKSSSGKGVSNMLTVVDSVSFCLRAGTSASLVGPSGSGKTTLLGLCAGLDRPTSGHILLDGVALETLGEQQLARVRNRLLGFVFQSFQLIPTLTALENVMVPAELRGEKGPRALATSLLERVGLGMRLQHYPAQLSGGEQQRVAIARAYVNRPRILFADEPTGNLDSDTGSTVEDLLFELNREQGTTLLIATHNRELARRTEQMLQIRGGKLTTMQNAETVSVVSEQTI